MDARIDNRANGSQQVSAGPSSGGIRRVWLAIAVGLAAALVSAGLAVAWHWRTHPDVFPDYGNGMGATLNEQTRSMYFAVTYPDPRVGQRITIESASPRIVENTAEATVDFYVCTLDVKEIGPGALGAADPREFARVCPDPVPVDAGVELNVGAEPPQQLMMAVTVHRPGLLRTRGVDLTYSHGWRTGTQAIGAHVEVSYQ